ncbi:MOSC domain-containing protein [Frankia sp. CNm7]|uniref:MOSC domain-containing protein n=1 Tax=Frankia nepalensis TaxID=1836974 RepID=UPI001D7A521E|nr:MOSC domain-containing protein [Frankia nepalensis]MBL7500411.1 MOSC domain-containing protein [Frankia nepalensis]MBL7511102.1 MOSC domain-containing protein [Frankia nepalensis]MBL7519770.1 MOSC domain-containing protein [Frankia nepalensis]
MAGRIVGVHVSPAHTFSKQSLDAITLLEGLGVRGDAHCGATVKHRSRVAADPSQPNLRQVHLIHAELLDELGNAGYEVLPGQLGENITTRGLELLSLPVGARLAVGDAVIQVTGLRNPCQQINNFRAGLLRQVLKKDGAGDVVRLAGIMGMVARGGTVRPGDPLEVRLPPEPHFPLTRV